MTGSCLGPPVLPFAPSFLVGRIPLLKYTTEKQVGTLILTSLLEDLAVLVCEWPIKMGDPLGKAG